MSHCLRLVLLSFLLSLSLFPLSAQAIFGLSNLFSEEKSRSTCEIIMEGAGYRAAMTSSQSHPLPFGEVGVYTFNPTFQSSLRRYYVLLEFTPSQEDLNLTARGGYSMWINILRAAEQVYARGGDQSILVEKAKSMIEPIDEEIYILKISSVSGLAGASGSRVAKGLKAFLQQLYLYAPLKKTAAWKSDFVKSWAPGEDSTEFFWLVGHYLPVFSQGLSPQDYILFKTHVMGNDRVRIKLSFEDLGFSSQKKMMKRKRKLAKRLVKFVAEAEDRGLVLQALRERRLSGRAALDLGSLEESASDSFHLEPSVGDPELLKLLRDKGYETLLSFVLEQESDRGERPIGDWAAINPGSYNNDPIESLYLPRSLEEDMKRQQVNYVADLLNMSIFDVVTSFGEMTTVNTIAPALAAQGFDLYLGFSDPRGFNPNKLLTEQNIRLVLERHEAQKAAAKKRAAAKAKEQEADPTAQ